MTLGDKEFMKTNIILDKKYLFKKRIYDEVPEDQKTYLI